MNKFDIINKYSLNRKDTGSSFIQIILITFKINNLNIHLKKNFKDNSSKLGLIKLLSKRKKLINYSIKKNKLLINKLLIDLSI